MKKLFLIASISLTTIGFAKQTVTCSASYRESSEVGFSDQKKLKVEIDQSVKPPLDPQFHQDPKMDVGEFTITMSPTDGLMVKVKHTKTNKVLYSVLDQTVSNLDTNHGMTGLHYIYSPDTSGWMNLYCVVSAKENSNKDPEAEKAK